MLFNSLGFAIFFPIVFVLYWILNKKGLRIQNFFLLGVSYYFYACWDWRFLFLLIFSTLLDYFTGIKMAQYEDKRKRRFWFWLSVIINLGFLGVFKYFNFFSSSFQEMVGHFGFHPNVWSLNIILPVGISFYTFHGLSYVIDIYNGKIKAEKNFVDYSLFVSYFPLLVAGPIERATHLLPQIKQPRVFDPAKTIDGLKQILWGLIKKVVIADQCAEIANQIFNNSSSQPGSTLLLGSVMFAVQIYGDFSGYSDIALGVSRLLGMELLQNFAFPYFSRDIAEFWRRWHISLSTWFRDYLYFPLGGSRVGAAKKIRNTFIIFLVSGFWHGANWTFIIWGLLNALYIMPSIIMNTNRNNLDIVARGRSLPTIKEAFQILITFGLTVLAWIFFRSQSVGQAFEILSHIFSKSLLQIPSILPIPLLGIVCLFFMVEWLGREEKYALAGFGTRWPVTLRWSCYYIFILAILFYSGSKQPFIYFQF